MAANGRDVYVTSQRSNSLTRLGVGKNGKLTFVGCVASKGMHGCGAARSTALRGAYAVALRGKTLYATAPAGAAVSAFALK